MNGAQGTVRVALAFAALLGALALVVHRQSNALVILRELDALRSERALVEAERAEVAASIQVLTSRTRVVREAAARLGLRVPTNAEMVILPVGAPPVEHGVGGLALERPVGGVRSGGQP
jgi:cell division protein FtsL